jgi:serine/threonine protein kinase
MLHSGERGRADRVLHGTLGRGGYGEVLAAVHDVIGRDVAIKVLHAKWSDDPEAVRRFALEGPYPAGVKQDLTTPAGEVGVARLATVDD